MISRETCLVRSHWASLVVGILLIMIGGISLWVWRNMPIYPDEIAMMISRGRFIQDHGVAYGLFPAVCEDTIQRVPGVFVAPAWLLSYMGLSLSSETLRVFPIATVLASLSVCFLYATLKGRPVVALWMLAPLVGVAGSGLVLARHEFAAEINLLVCFLSLLALEACSRSILLRIVLVVLLVLSSLFSTYVHIQGLLFLPLTALLIYRVLLGISKWKWFPAAFALAFLVVLVKATLLFQSASCVAHPEIDHFMRAMTYGGDKGWLSALQNLPVGYQEYVRRFLYLDAYSSAYLPPVSVGLAMKRVTALNGLIVVVVTLQALAMVVIAGHGMYNFALAMTRRGRPLCAAFTHAIGTRSMALACAAIPVLFLFAYDPAHNFYRVFFLNFTASIIATFYFSTITSDRFGRAMQWGCASLVVLAVIASSYANSRWFSPSFKEVPGYEGPSMSLSRYDALLEANIRLLDGKCRVGSERGGVILDDLTYHVLKHSPHVYPITYLSRQASLMHVPLAEVIAQTRADVVIARCESFKIVDLPFAHRQADICCVDLTAKGPEQ